MRGDFDFSTRPLYQQECFLDLRAKQRRAPSLHLPRPLEEVFVPFDAFEGGVERATGIPLFVSSTETLRHILIFVVERPLTPDVVKNKLALVNDSQRINCRFDASLLKLLFFPATKSAETTNGSR